MNRINGNADRQDATGLPSMTAAPLLSIPQLGGEPQPHPQRTRVGMVWSVVEWWVAFTLAILTAPAVAVLAFAVWFDTGGPVFYRGDRVGRNGYFFRMWKLRTMHVDAGPLVAKTPADPRITRVGRWLRRTSLDELPQLWNVLAGDMSLVGPRPHCLYEVQRCGEDGLRRLRVKPGMTGLSQISGRSDLSKSEQIRFDLDYLEGWSPWRDLQILAWTLPSVLKAKGAY